MFAFKNQRSVFNDQKARLDSVDWLRHDVILLSTNALFARRLPIRINLSTELFLESGTS